MFSPNRTMDSGIGQGSLSGSRTGDIAGIETSLRDLSGKFLNVPAYVLLGGRFRDKVLLCHDPGSPNVKDPKPEDEVGFRVDDESPGILKPLDRTFGVLPLSVS